MCDPVAMGVYGAHNTLALAMVRTGPHMAPWGTAPAEEKG